MVGFTFSAEQVISAPPEVRRWMENEISKALGGAANVPAAPSSKVEESGLAICLVDEMAELFRLISGNLLAAQVFFELARDAPFNRAAAPLHSFNIGDMLRHARLTNADQLFKCFDAINRDLCEIRNNSDASLFAFDEAGHVYIHETTYRSIRQIWEQVLLAHSASAKSEPAAGAPTGPEPIMRPEHAFGGTP
jgi:hypothetical protein